MIFDYSLQWDLVTVQVGAELNKPDSSLSGNLRHNKQHDIQLTSSEDSAADIDVTIPEPAAPQSPRFFNMVASWVLGFSPVPASIGLQRAQAILMNYLKIFFSPTVYLGTATEMHIALKAMLHQIVVKPMKLFGEKGDKE
jgi:hypothetical protein